jgi:nucleoside 2-deoxyribosyltransferase
MILHDVAQGIVDARVIVAEITPPNQNVFYELGYAHALGKPTILLAEREKNNCRSTSAGTASCSTTIPLPAKNKWRTG